MKRSGNEIGNLVLKAGRGAGIPLGHCEDLAVAAMYLAATDPVRLPCLIDALAGPHRTLDAVWLNGELRCASARAVMAGPAALDAIKAGFATVVLCDLDAPRLVLALFAANAVAVDHRFQDRDLILQPSSRAKVAQPAASHVTVPSVIWTALADLAANTYVPASDASRAAGAGAGLNDND